MYTCRDVDVEVTLDNPAGDRLERVRVGVELHPALLFAEEAAPAVAARSTSRWSRSNQTSAEGADADARHRKKNGAFTSAQAHSASSPSKGAASPPAPGRGVVYETKLSEPVSLKGSAVITVPNSFYMYASNLYSLEYDDEAVQMLSASLAE